MNNVRIGNKPLPKETITTFQCNLLGVDTCDQFRIIDDHQRHMMPDEIHRAIETRLREVIGSADAKNRDSLPSVDRCNSIFTMLCILGLLGSVAVIIIASIETNVAFLYAIYFPIYLIIIVLFVYYFQKSRKGLFDWRDNVMIAIRKYCDNECKETYPNYVFKVDNPSKEVKKYGRDGSSTITGMWCSITVFINYQYYNQS